MEIPLFAIARGHEGHWEAICLDFDIAVQGRTFNEVEGLLRVAVETYVEDAMKEDEATRAKLLARRAPLSARLSWIGGLIFAALCGRMERRERDGNASSATVPFAVPCHA
jgi:predicted RNase H-like HicB family nuclease